MIIHTIFCCCKGVQQYTEGDNCIEVASGNQLATFDSSELQLVSCQHICQTSFAASPQISRDSQTCMTSLSLDAVSILSNLKLVLSLAKPRLDIRLPAQVLPVIVHHATVADCSRRGYCKVFHFKQQRNL